MTKSSISAGLLLYRFDGKLSVLLAHPGGPYFFGKDEGSWSIPKGLVHNGEDLLTAAKREFVEETGYELAPDTDFVSLGSVQLKGGKQVHGWAFPGVWEAGRKPESNTFDIEWPPRSGRKQAFPEIDRAKMFSLKDARQKINERQQPFLDRLAEYIGGESV